MRKTIIIGNWKMNKTPAEAKKFMDTLHRLYEANRSKIRPHQQYGFAVPAVTLATVQASANPDCLIAAQNMHFAEHGAYTGELSATMLEAVGANSVVLGHSERRTMFHETDLFVNQKVHAALQHNLTPIVCVGETLAQYEAHETRAVIKKALLGSLKGVKAWDKIVIAYEPIWAIGTGKTATAAIAQAVCQYIRSITAPQVRIQYGGSVKPENIAQFLAQPDIDGALVGGAALDPDSFLKLLTRNQ